MRCILKKEMARINVERLIFLASFIINIQLCCIFGASSDVDIINNNVKNIDDSGNIINIETAPGNIVTSSATENVHSHNNNNDDKVEETLYRKEDHMNHVDEDNIIENRNNIDTSDIIQESIDGIGSLILPTEDSTHNIDTPADEVTTLNVGNIFPEINNEENNSNEEHNNERGIKEKDYGGEITEHTAREKIKDNESTTTMADKPESSLSAGEDKSQGVKDDGEDGILIEVDVVDQHEASLGKEETEEIDELTEQEPIFIPDDDELVDDNLFRDIIQDEKIDQMNQNGNDISINDNSETTNTVKPNNVDNQGTTATIISPQTREYDNRPTEEEMITYSLFQLYSYILAIFLFILCFLIWIMWLRYNDVISAVHGSKGALFFETPPNVRVTENWTGLPGAHCRPSKEHFQKKNKDNKKKNFMIINSIDKKNNNVNNSNSNVHVIPIIASFDGAPTNEKKKKKKKKKTGNK